MAYREFITAVEEKVSDGPQPITITLGKTVMEERDGAMVEIIEKREVTAHPPGEGMVAMMMARMSRHSTTNDKIAGIIDFFVEVLEEGDHEYVVARLMDRKDPFGITDVTNVMTHLVEEWGKRPTK